MRYRVLAFGFVVCELTVLLLVADTVRLPGVGSVRLEFLGAWAIILVFLPLVGLAVVRVVLQRPVIPALVLLAFLVHPLVVTWLFASGLRPLPFPEFNPYQPLVSGATWLVHALVVAVIWDAWSIHEHRRFLKVLWAAGYLVAIEALLTYFVLRGISWTAWSALVDEGRFNSVTGMGADVAGVLAMVLPAHSIAVVIKRRGGITAYLGVILGAVLVAATLTRGVLLAWVSLLMLGGLYAAASLVARRRRTGRPLMTWGAGGLLALLITVGGARALHPDLFNPSSTIDRFMIWARAIEISAHYFPIGCGGGLCERYMRSPVVPPTLTRQLAGFQGDVGDVLSQRFDVRVSAEGSGQLVSTHSMQIQLVCDYGLIGLGLLVWMLATALAVMLGALRQLWRGVGPQRHAKSYFLAVATVGIHLIASLVSIGYYMLWILVALHIGSAAQFRAETVDARRKQERNELLTLRTDA